MPGQSHYQGQQGIKEGKTYERVRRPFRKHVDLNDLLRFIKPKRPVLLNV